MRALVLVLACAASCRGVAPARTGAPAPAAPTPAPHAEPIDVMLVVDLSKSMEETDLPPERFGAMKRAVRRFVAANHHDRLGLILFGQEPVLRQPLTSDTRLLDRTLAGVNLGDVPEYGTAIGDALGLAIEQLQSSPPWRRVAILLADGDSNWTRRYDPDQAADAAKAAGITVYTVLVGTEGTGAFGGMSVNPKTLEHIAATTGGRFYRASDDATFDQGLDDIQRELEAARAK